MRSRAMPSIPDAIPPDALQQAFLGACRAELDALKPGNVHIHADGHGMTVQDFLDSAAAAAPPLCRRGSPVGERIRDAVAASRAAVPTNTNLGIILLAAPLIAAAERRDGAFRDRLRRVLDALTIDDARDAFAAIVRANPAGLGRIAEQDVAAPPTVTLLEAMRLAAGRDRIARQYATGYEDVFAIGVARIEQERRRDARADWVTTLVFLDFLAGLPDSHIARKFGSEAAERVRDEAAALRRTLAAEPDAAFPALLVFDYSLKGRGLNPGTSADLTVASLLACAVQRAPAGL
jgi:triphosphoribosyl-dephospho-CoA synthase